MAPTPCNDVRIQLARPWIGEAEIDATRRVLESGALSLGPELPAFEAEFGERFGGMHAIGVSSGTAGLYAALWALGIDGGEVITPSYGFIATAHAIHMAGATPRFCEIDPDTYCVTTETLEAAWSEDVRAVIPVDLFGTPAPMREIREWARSKGIPVIEDSCEAIGSIDRGDVVGTVCDASSFAFYPNKQMTTGEGGIVLTHDADLAARMRSFRNQGRGEQEFEFTNVGFNLRLTDLQAAIGRVQLGRLDEMLAARERVARAYDERLLGTPGLAGLSALPSKSKRSWFVYIVRVEEAAWRDPVRSALHEAGIQTSPYFRPVHAMAPYAKCPAASDLSETSAAGEQTFAIPFHPLLSETEIDEVSTRLRSAVEPLASTAKGRFGEPQIA